MPINLTPPTLGLQILFWSLISLSTCYSQYTLSLEGPNSVNWCEPITYTYTVENNASSSSPQQLEFQFSQEVKFIAGGLSANDSSYISIDLSESESCDYITGEITVLPACNAGLFSILDTKVSLSNGINVAACIDYRTIVNGSALSISFGSYQYMASTNELTKSLVITNQSSSTVSEFKLSLEIANEFALLTTTSLGSIESPSTIAFSDTDIPQGALAPGESLTTEIKLSLIECDISAVAYNIEVECSTNNCIISTPFVDDNEVENSEVAFQMTFPYQYGFCDPEYNRLLLQNPITNNDVNISDVYNLVLYLSYFSRTTNDCQEVDFKILDLDLDFENGDSLYVVNLSQLTIDPDGPGGISDLDDDGQFDDLAAGDSIEFFYGIRFFQECANQTFGDRNRLVIRSESQNICGKINSTPNVGSNALNSISISDRSWTFLPKDNTGQRFINVDDSIEWLIDINFGLPRKYLNCIDPVYELAVKTPPNLEWIENEGINFIDRTDSNSIVIPYEIQDSLIVFDVTTLKNGYLRMNFRGVCPDDALVGFDPTIPLHQQCLVWQDYSVMARLNILCDYDETCEPIENFRDLFSTNIRTACLDLQDEYSIISTPGPTVNRYNGGWMDVNKTQRWNPDLHGLSSNNSTYYDHDTMRVRIPFTFNHINALEELRLNFGNRLNQQEIDLEMITSTISRYDKATGQLIASCDARTSTIDRFKTTSLVVSDANFLTNCISESDSMVWELLLELNVERSSSLERVQFVQEDLKFTVEEDLGNCLKTTTTLESNYQVSEVFIPRLFSISFNTSSFRSEFHINTRIPIGTGLEHRLLSRFETAEENINFLYENRERISFNDISYVVPSGFELENEQILIVQERDSFFFTATTAGIVFITDTLLIVNPTFQTTEITGTRYRFDIPNDILSLLSIEDDFFIRGAINSVCPPVRENPNLTISGSLNYIDYYEGTFDDTLFEFGLLRELTYIPYDYTLEDDFQITGDESSIFWTISDQNRFPSSEFLEVKEEEFILEYSAKNMQIDSAKFVLEYSHAFENLPPIDYTGEITLNSLNDSTFLFSPIYSVDSTDPFYWKTSTKIRLFTSNQACGYDSLFYKIGNKSLWDRNLCIDAAYSDTIVAFTPVGIPQIKLERSPEVSNFCTTSSLQWTYENLGQGGLTHVNLMIESPQLSDPLITIKTEDSTVIATFVPNYLNGSYSWPFDTIGIDTIRGILDQDYIAYNCTFSWLADCNTPSLLELNLSSNGLTYCDERLSSNSIKSPLIPLAAGDNQAFSIELLSFTDGPCTDDIKMRTIINHPQTGSLENDSLVIVLPQEYPFISGSTTADGNPIGDPMIITKDGDQFLIWRNQLSTSADVTTIDFLLDSSCDDECGGGEGQAFLFSKTAQNCQSSENPSCTRQTLRANTVRELLFWRPRFDLALSNTSLITSDNDNSTVAVTLDISEIRDNFFTGKTIIRYFADEDQNGILGTNELIISTTEQVMPDSQRVILIDTILVANEFLCNLSVSINPDHSCACFNHSAAIDLSQSAATNRNVSACSATTIDLSSYTISACVPTWSSHPRLVITGNVAVYDKTRSGGLMGTDTIIFSQNCSGCIFLDTLYISDNNYNIEFEEIQEACDRIGPSYRANIIEADIPEASYQWNNDPLLNSNILTDVQPGLNFVEVVEANGCIQRDSFNYDFIPLVPEAIFSGNPCDSTQGLVIVEIDPFYDNYVFSWDDGFRERERPFDAVATYPFTLTNDDCFRQFSVVTNFDEVQNNFSNINLRYEDVYEVTQGEPFQIFPISGDTAGLQIIWENASSLNCTDCFNPIITTIDEVVLIVRLVDDNNCERIQEILINTVIDTIIALPVDTIVDTRIDKNIYIPNVFAPASRVNNIFSPPDHPSIESILAMRVFDRWGNNVHERQNILPGDSAQGWNGTHNDNTANSGVYVYHFKLLLINGEIIDITGSVTLL